MATLEECLKLKDEFKQRWTLQNVKDMTINQYTGIGDKDTFTYWLESKTEKLISIWGGSAYKFGIFKRAQKDGRKELKPGQTGDIEYGWYKKYGNNRNEAFEKIKSIILQVINYAQNKEFEKIDDIDLGDAVKWKIAFLYAPDKTLLRIVSRDAFEYLARRNNIESNKISQIQKELIKKKPDNIDFYDYSFSLWNEYAKENDLKQDVLEEKGNELADNNKTTTYPLNQILYGPPGTGKTYTTIAKAIEIIKGEKVGEEEISDKENRKILKKQFDEYVQRGQIKFVTFHQSYGYEEFVEGIKPVLGNDETDSDKEIKYDTEDGIFKKLCKTAQNIEGNPSETLVFKDSMNFWKMSLGDSQNPEEDFVFEYCIKNNVVLLGFGKWINFSDCKNIEQISKLMEKEKTDFSAIAINRLKNEIKNGDIILISLGNKKLRAVAQVTGEYKFLDRNDLGSFVQARGVKWIFIPDEPVYYEKILYKQFSQMSIYNIKYNLKIDAFKQIFIKDDQKNEKNYVLIIDEINRGNISKIFGELITLIEPSKRLTADDEIMVELPYSKEKFGVPSNLYIIGTMNTADRSIALMDTALRRRFEFVEMMPQYDELKKITIEGINIGEMLEAINERIEYLYDRDHAIGHAYFISLKDDADISELASIFKNKILPLLQEYFYDDWEKIRLVLGDNKKQKDSRTQFITKEEKKASDLFGRKIDDIDDKVLYKINDEAFNKAQSYIEIYKSSSD